MLLSALYFLYIISVNIKFLPFTIYTQHICTDTIYKAVFKNIAFKQRTMGAAQ